MNQATLETTTQFLNRARQTIQRLDRGHQLQSIETRFAANPNASKKQLFGECDDEQWLWLNTEGIEQVEFLRRCLPPLPPREVQLRFTGDAGQSTLRRAWAVYSRLRQLCSKYNVGRRVLEFGCGWGRILRYWVRDLEPENLHGVDVHPEMIALCNSASPWAQITRCQSQPPAPMPDQHFDLIYAYSVFTHLSEAAHLAWLGEFDRLLRPGGVLVLTTRPRGFIEMCARYSASNDTSPWMAGLKTAFPDPAKSLADYDAGRFLFAPVGGGDYLSSDFYGEACVPLDYVKRVWTEKFALCDWSEEDDYQLFLVLRKPGGPSRG